MDRDTRRVALDIRTIDEQRMGQRESMRSREEEANATMSTDNNPMQAVVRCQEFFDTYVAAEAFRQQEGDDSL
jgi:hypothetical protein